jgi:hypothetical protein
MRTRIIFSLSALLLAGPVMAQDEGADFEDPQETEDETETARDAERPVQGDRVRTRPGQGGQATAPGEVHTVVKGDTLWDLSQTYLGSPWYWPKVWSYNPEIANPHWIYPGNRVRFFPTGEEVPSRVEVGGGPTIVAGGDDEVPTPFDEEVGTVKATGRIGYRPPAAAILPLQGFVTQRELDAAGRIAGSFAEAEMLSFPDTVYIRFKNRGDVQVGGRYVVYRTAGKVEHPDGTDVGFLTHFLGTVKVLRLDRDVVTAQIDNTWDEIRRGDLIGPLNEELSTRVASRPNEREVEGTLVGMMIPHLTMAGEHHTVVVDRGSSHGVQPGNTFNVLRSQDMGGPILNPQQGQDKKWPEESVASCVILEVKDRASTCLLVRSIREVVRGDRMVMRVTPQTTAQR